VKSLDVYSRYGPVVDNAVAVLGPRRVTDECNTEP
jgi:hypothetical protein